MKKRFSMKNPAMALALALGLFGGAEAAVRGNYVGSTTTGVTYTPITGGTLLQGTGWDDQSGSVNFSTAITLPFTFTYDSVAYTQVFVNPNGFIGLGGGTAPGNQAYVPISNNNTTSTNYAFLSAFGGDLEGQAATAEVRYETLAGANRQFVVQWKNCQPYTSGTTVTHQLNMQLVLEENTNKIFFNYGPQTGTAAATFQVGIRGPVGNNPTTDYENYSGATWAGKVRGTAPTQTVTIGSANLPVPDSRITFALAVDPVLAISSVSVTEGNSGTTVATINGTVTNPSASPIDITYSTANGTATAADNDFVSESATAFQIPASATTFSFPINVNGDAFPEQNEAFTVSIAAVTPSIVIGSGTATVTVTDDDFVCGATENFSTAVAPSTPPAGWSNVELTAGGGLWVFNNPSARTITGMTAPFAMFDSDFLDDDGIAENSALVTPAMDFSSAIYVNFSVKQVFESSFGGEAIIEASTDGGATWPIVLQDSIADIGSGVSSAGGAAVTSNFSANALAGSANAKIRFRWVGDFSYWWAVDDLQVCVGNLPPGTSSVSVGAATASESGGTLNVPFTANPANAADITVNYSITPGTATNPADFTGPLSGTVTIPGGGSGTANLSIPLVNNSNWNPAGAGFTVSLTGIVSGSAVLGTTSAAATIANDDIIPTGYLFGTNRFPAASAGFAYLDPGAPTASDGIALNAAVNGFGGGDFANSVTQFVGISGTTVYQVNPTNLAFSTLGSISGLVDSLNEAIIAMNWDRPNSRFLVLTQAGVASTLRIYSLDYTGTPGALTLVGTMSTGIPAGSEFTTLAVRPTDGALFLIDTGTTDRLFQGSISSGVLSLTPIGANLGVALQNYPGGSDFDNVTGTLYWTQSLTSTDANNLFTINTTTGAASASLGTIEASNNQGQLIGLGVANVFVSGVEDWTVLD